LTFRRGYEFNHPLEPVVLEAPSQNGSRPETHSFIRVSPDEVVVSCVKIGEDSDDLIVRVYDAGGGGALTRIHFGLPVVAAFETDLIERATSRLRTRKDSVTIRLRPFDIRTLRVRVRQPGGRG